MPELYEKPVKRPLTIRGFLTVESQIFFVFSSTWVVCLRKCTLVEEIWTTRLKKTFLSVLHVEIQPNW
jgi:hypothetical protein